MKFNCLPIRFGKNGVGIGFIPHKNIPIVKTYLPGNALLILKILFLLNISKDFLSICCKISNVVTKIVVISRPQDLQCNVFLLLIQVSKRSRIEPMNKTSSCAPFLTLCCCFSFLCNGIPYKNLTKVFLSFTVYI